MKHEIEKRLGDHESVKRNIFCESKVAVFFYGSLTKTFLYALLLFIVTFLAFQPGIMSNDSFNQFGQALNVSFTDQHPPMMAIWWSLLTILYDSPATLLIFHLVMLWSALYLLATKYKNNYILLIGLLPFVVNFSDVLWKDVGLAYSWLLALSVLLNMKK